MGDFTFRRGQLNSIILTVLRLSGTIPDPLDYTTPILRISHINGIGEIEDLVNTPMTQVSATNRWYYKYAIPNDCTLTRYLVTFSTTIEGVDTIATEEFMVAQDTSTSGSGEFPIELDIVNSVTLIPISNAQVFAYDKSNPTVVIASGLSNIDGKAYLYLSAGSYALSFQKEGVISEVHTLTVHSNGTYEMDGD
jgi:hypothetical protein